MTLEEGTLSVIELEDHFYGSCNRSWTFYFFSPSEIYVTGGFGLDYSKHDDSDDEKRGSH